MIKINICQFLLFVFIIISGANCHYEHDNDNGDKLLLVHAIGRHGDRAPGQVYPTDPHTEDDWPLGFGELTELGMREQFALGQLHRRRYILNQRFVNKIYSPKEIYARSTDYNRTILSAAANLAGMFPAGVAGVDFPALAGWPSHWSPIPVHTVPLATDDIGSVDALCPRKNQLLSGIYTSTAFAHFQSENAQFLQFLSNKTGSQITVFNINVIYRTIGQELKHNLIQPAWLTDAVWQRIENVTLNFENFYLGTENSTFSTELIRLRGSLFRDIFDRMELKLKCTQNSSAPGCSTWISRFKFQTYSTHNYEVAEIFCIMGNKDALIGIKEPEMSSSILIELWDRKNRQGPAVKVLFRRGPGSTKYRTVTNTINACAAATAGTDQGFCSWQVFRQVVLPLLPTNYTKECEAK